MNKTDTIINLKFETPIHGWMNVRLSSIGLNIQADVSDVLLNSLELLLNSLINLKECSNYEEVEWFLEPAFMKWTFKKVKENKIELKVVNHESFRKNAIFICDEIVLFYNFYKGLQGLSQNPCWKKQDFRKTGWAWEFPNEQLKKLENILK